MIKRTPVRHLLGGRGEVVQRDRVRERLGVDVGGHGPLRREVLRHRGEQDQEDGQGEVRLPRLHHGRGT